MPIENRYYYYGFEWMKKISRKLQSEILFLLFCYFFDADAYCRRSTSHHISRFEFVCEILTIWNFNFINMKMSFYDVYGVFLCLCYVQYIIYTMFGLYVSWTAGWSGLAMNETDKHFSIAYTQNWIKPTGKKWNCGQQQTEK